MNSNQNGPMTQCPRCEHMTFEHLGSYSQCVGCLYSEDYSPKDAKASLNTGRSFLERLQACEFSLTNLALLAIVATLAACASVNTNKENQNEEAAKREQRQEMRQFHVDRHVF